MFVKCRYVVNNHRKNEYFHSLYACEKVASDLWLDGGFRQVLRFPDLGIGSNSWIGDGFHQALRFPLPVTNG